MISSGENGTVTAPFDSTEHGMGWITAGHCVDGTGVDVRHDDDGDKYLESSDDLFGVSREYIYDRSGEVDLAFIDQKSGKMKQHTI